jgi:protein-L-isoaspartate(D-aspartate) O-methyltransferase
VPRHEFVPAELRAYSYLDSPLPIGHDKTISQPFIVALMLSLLQIRPSDAALEIGTGLGYGAAVLGKLAAKVYSVEIIPELSAAARKRLAGIGAANVEIRTGDGSRGWPEHAPFDRIVATAAPELIPPALVASLKSGGRMVLPVGLAESQQLLLVEKDRTGRVASREILPVRFSAMVMEQDFGPRPQ